MKQHLKRLTTVGLGLGIGLLFVSSVFAADLNWSTDTNITIGGNTYTIIANSQVTSLAVGATSVTVTVPAGDSFTLKSPNKFTLNHTGNANQVCSSAGSEISVAGAQTAVVITPDTASTCSGGGGAGGNSGGGGGGGGTAAPAPATTPATTPAPSGTPVPTAISKATPASKGFVSLAKLSLKEGDTISASGSSDPDIYIANASGYKRLFLNPVIFNFYGHLGGFKEVKKITSKTRETLVTSGLFRNCETNDPKVYGVETTGEDTGVLHWVNTSGAQAVADDPDFFKKVFCVNSKEFNWYKKGTTYTSVNQVPDYTRGR